MDGALDDPHMRPAKGDRTLTGRNLLLIAHIASAMLFVGPVTVAASLFPRAVSTQGDVAVARVFHRITRTYGVCSFAVLAVGVALASTADLWSATWLQVSFAIYGVGTAVLLGSIVPLQRRLLSASEAGEISDVAAVGRLHGLTGAFSLSWVVVLVLMVVKPW